MYFNSEAEMNEYFKDGIPSNVLAVVQPDESDKAVLFTTSNNTSASGTMEDLGGYNIDEDDRNKIDYSYEGVQDYYTYGATQSYVADYVSTYGSSTDLTGYATESYVVNKIEDVVGAAPAALDTLKEIGDSLNNDADFAGTMTAALAGKANASDVYTKSAMDSILADYATEEFATIPVYDSERGYVRYRQMGKTMELIGAAEMEHEGVDEDGNAVATYFVLDDMASKSYVADYVSTYGGGEDNVQADWNVTDSTADSYILNKPFIYNPSNGSISTLTSIANGINSQAFGDSTYAKSAHSHTEGYGTYAMDNQAHAEGSMTTASGQASHAEGVGSYAKGKVSHAGGFYTYTYNMYETAIGTYNASYSASGMDSSQWNPNTSTIFTIGIGPDKNNRKNAIQINRLGDLYAYGVGNYDGTNATAADSYTLSYVINDLQDQIDNIPSGGSVDLSAYVSKDELSAASYATNASLSNYLPLSGGTISGNINPNTSGQRSLGTSSKKWGSIYVNTLYADNVNNQLNNISNVLNNKLGLSEFAYDYYIQDDDAWDSYIIGEGFTSINYDEPIIDDEHTIFERSRPLIFAQNFAYEYTEDGWEVSEEDREGEYVTYNGFVGIKVDDGKLYSINAKYQYNEELDGDECTITTDEFATKSYVESLIGTALSLSEIIVGEETEPEPEPAVEDGWYITIGDDDTLIPFVYDDEMYMYKIADIDDYASESLAKSAAPSFTFRVFQYEDGEATEWFVDSDKEFNVCAHGSGDPLPMITEDLVGSLYYQNDNNKQDVVLWLNVYDNEGTMEAEMYCSWYEDR